MNELTECDRLFYIDGFIIGRTVLEFGGGMFAVVWQFCFIELRMLGILDEGGLELLVGFGA